MSATATLGIHCLRITDNSPAPNCNHRREEVNTVHAIPPTARVEKCLNLTLEWVHPRVHSIVVVA